MQIQDSTEGYQVTLDHRNLRTPGGQKLLVPREKRAMAILIANEWDNQDEVLKQHALPMGRLSPLLPGPSTVRALGVLSH